MAILYCDNENVIYIYIYIYTHKNQEKTQGIQFSLNFKPWNYYFPIKTVNIGTKIIIQIKLYMHFLTLDKE